MDISALSSSNTSSSTTKASASLAENFDTFLSLLTTQLQNQDPLSPMDSNEFTSQLVQFAGVEQSIATNTNLETLVNMSMANYVDSALGYLGQEVSIGGSYAGMQSGSALWGYEIAQGAETVQLTVKDSDSNIVYQGAGETAEGTHNFNWNGRDSAGDILPDGVYSLEIDARTSTGESVVSSTQISGIVSSVEFDGTEPVLVVDGLRVTMDAVLKVTAPETNGATTTDTTDTDQSSDDPETT